MQVVNYTIFGNTDIKINRQIFQKPPTCTQSRLSPPVTAQAAPVNPWHKVVPDYI